MTLSRVDFRHAVRTVASRTGLTLSLIGSLGGGIALATVTVSVLNAVLFVPLPLQASPQARRRVGATRRPPGRTGRVLALGILDVRERNRTLGIAAIGDGSVNLTGAGEAEQLRGELVTWNCFQVLEIESRAGPQLRGV